MSIPASANEGEAEMLAAVLDEARQALELSASRSAAVLLALKALNRIAAAIRRPLRIAILGESNSGKSSIANLLLGEATLPAQPVANTRLPTLLYFADAPVVTAVDFSGNRTIVVGPSIAPKSVQRLEVGLPVPFLSRIEILDFPGSSDPLFRVDLSSVPSHGVDGAIWATVATQAWRETERLAWLGLPPRIRMRGILAVTHTDRLASQEDYNKVRSRLIPIAQRHFCGLAFLSATAAFARGNASAQGGWDGGVADLRSAVENLREGFVRERVGKAIPITRTIASRALSSLG